MPNSSGHSVAAVDHALRVLLLLSERQRLRVVDVAAELGVARSTAHRLLSTLQQHEFAVLVRPDRHVAWRSMRYTTDSAQRLPAVIEQALGLTGRRA